MDLLSLLITLFPLLGALIAALCTRYNHKKIAQFSTSTLVVTTATISWYLFFTLGDEVHIINIAHWIHIGSFKADWSIYVDSLTALMFIVVTTVSAIVHLYSIGYMNRDPNIPRFFSYISLFTFCMLMLVASDNFVQMFFGWEGVGLCSYLLIGFWFKKDSANNAAMKAFIVNRVGDLSLILGIALIYFLFDSVLIAKVLDNVSQYQLHYIGGIHTLTIITILLFIGCMGKSAQIGLHVWLPDAMEGPTPVSALIHAATMVTAGVFLIVRCSPLFELAPFTGELIVLVGGLTCLMAATIALVQTDIKKIIAYSTCSQLGYMFMACGLSAHGVAMFHLTTHAFFKALLFLCAGNVLHFVPGGVKQVQELPSRLWRKLPYTYVFMWIASLALMGIFPLAGFFSKDLILEFAYNNSFAFIISLSVVWITAFYSCRSIITIFHRCDEHNNALKPQIQEKPKIMLWTLLPIVFLSITSGFFAKNFLHINSNDFWHESIYLTPVPHITKNIPLAALLTTLSGSIAAYLVRNTLINKRKWDLKCAEIIYSVITFSTYIMVFTYSLLGYILLAIVLLILNISFTLFYVVKKKHAGSVLSTIKEWYRALHSRSRFANPNLILKYPLNLKLLLSLFKKVHRVITDKYYFDEVYNVLFTKVTKKCGYALWQKIDIHAIDKFSIGTLVSIADRCARRVVALQTGFVFDYTLSMLLGIVVIIGLFVYLL